MGRSTKDAWLTGPGDLKEDDVEDVPVPGSTVRVSGLSAFFSNQASSEALELKTVGDEQRATVNTARLEVIQFAHGCVEPQFSLKEAEAISRKFGPAFKKVIAKIDELSGVDKEAIENAQARFPSGSNGDAGTPPGDSGPDVPVPSGPAVGDAG